MDPLRIGLILDSDLAYQRGVLRGIKQYALSKPHWVLVIHDTDGVNRNTLRQMRPDGLVAHIGTERLVRALRSQRRPVVNVASLLSDGAFPHVMVDHRHIGRMAFGHLRECGLKQFGIVGHPRHLYSIERERGFVDALAEDRYPCSHYYERPTTSYRHRARLLALNSGLQRWLQALPKPVGVFACHDVWGVQVIDACRLIRLRVPEDVAVIGVDNDDLLCEIARPSMSSIIVPALQIGFEAAALLERLLTSRWRPRKPHLVPPSGVVVRQSSDLVAIEDRDVSAAVRFIRDHSHLPLQVSDVLRAVPVSRRGLEQKFRATLERGIREEILRVHLERAKHLLAHSSLSIVEVAQQVGFAGIHQLSRAFRRETGETPSSYRRRFRAQVRGVDGGE